MKAEEELDKPGGNRLVILADRAVQQRLEILRNIGGRRRRLNSLHAAIDRVGRAGRRRQQQHARAAARLSPLPPGDQAREEHQRENHDARILHHREHDRRQTIAGIVDPRALPAAPHDEHRRQQSDNRLREEPQKAQREKHHHAQEKERDAQALCALAVFRRQAQHQPERQQAIAEIGDAFPIGKQRAGERREHRAGRRVGEHEQRRATPRTGQLVVLRDQLDDQPPMAVLIIGIIDALAAGIVEERHAEQKQQARQAEKAGRLPHAPHMDQRPQPCRHAERRHEAHAPGKGEEIAHQNQQQALRAKDRGERALHPPSP